MTALFRSGPALAAGLVLLAGPAGAAEVDPYLPDDSEVLVTVNVRQVLDSPLVKKSTLEKLREALKNIDMAEDVLKDLDFDPFKDLDRVLVASPGGSEPDKGLIIARGRYDLARFKARADEAARDNPDNLKIHKIPDGSGGRFLVYEVTPPDQDQPLFVALAAGDVLLASGGKDYVVEALKRAARKGKPALKSKAFAALLGKMDDKQSLSVAAVGSALARSGLPEGPVKDALAGVEAVGGGGKIADDEFKLEVVVVAGSAREAREIKRSADKGIKQALLLLGLAASAKQELAPLFEIAKTMRVSAREKIVIIKARVGADEIEDALKKEE